MPTNKEIFGKYINPVFIETGTNSGDGVQAALDAGFKTIYSIELSPRKYNYCVERFRDNPNVHLIWGDSAVELGKLLEERIAEPATFWLDGHLLDEDYEKGILYSPVLRELEAIARHPIKTHTILIDDLRIWTIDQFGFDKQMLMDKIRSINPRYEFTFEDGQLGDWLPFKNDILVAQCL